MELVNKSCTLEPGEYKELVKLCFETQKLANAATVSLLGIGLDINAGAMDEIMSFPYNALEQIVPADWVSDEFFYDFIDINDFEQFWTKYFEKEI